MVNFGFYHVIDAQIGELVPNTEQIMVISSALLDILDVRWTHGRYEYPTPNP